MKKKRTPNQQLAQHVEALLTQMTLSEKIGQMSQVRHFDEGMPAAIKTHLIGSVIHTEGPNPGEDAEGWQAKFRALQKLALSTRLKIPLLIGVDAVHGQNTFEGATIFPHNIGLGAAANSDLVEKAAAITAVEAQATGFNWVFSPCVAIPMNEKWGRVYEAFSENTELTTRLTRASVKGHQGYNGKIGVMATAKHFIGDGATDFGLEGGSTTLSRAEVIQRLLPPYQAAVQSGVGSIMASFNTLDGISMHAHQAMITDMLKGELDFQGMVVSDWKAYSRFGQNDIIKAGIDMVMAVDGDLEEFQEGVRLAVLNGTVSEDRINDAVRRILRQKFRFGLFENPFPDKGLISKIGIPEHRKIARQAVRESLVLLKNENQTLPLNPSSRIVVVGPFGNNSGLQSGGWTLTWQGTSKNYAGATTILDGIKKFAHHQVRYDPNGKAAMDNVDVAIIVIGENPYAEFFGDVGGEMDLFQLSLTQEQQNYHKTYTEKGIKTVVVLISGRPLVTTQQIEQSDAFVAAWLPGSEGDGIAELLFGLADFKGTLPHSWPKSEQDYQGKYGPNFWDKSVNPLFPIGYGLSYQKST
ncbi:glycoside hydrolase family 3 N-terminal domain-containing protein [Algoriphagus sp.]|uniref:glycoside hydrolase family 3 protein n=1 Tax=Algoriphagus sp. TaxID=1872435 RepID=UPI00262B554E|nr:glycoside hydrolase family 3 N-terminal domain-containing protein [Algoriphagus sp.]